MLSGMLTFRSKPRSKRLNQKRTKDYGIYIRKITADTGGNS